MSTQQTLFVYERMTGNIVMRKERLILREPSDVDSLSVSIRTGNSCCPESVSTVRKVPCLVQVTGHYQPCGFAQPIPGVS